MSHSSTTTLLRSRRTGAQQSQMNNDGRKTSSTSLPLHRSSTTTSLPSRMFSRTKAQRGQTAIFLAVALVLLGLVGGSFFQLRGSSDGVAASQVHNGGRALLDAAALEVEGPVHDIVIAGAGPGGLTAALFGARAGLDVLVLGSEAGLLSETQHLDNFPSYTEGNGPTWLKATKAQARQFGAKFATPGVLATQLERNDNGLFTLTTNSPHAKEQTIHAWSVIVASGATPRHLGLPRENLMWGKTLHNCAICDGHLYLDKTVMVVGGGDSALDAAILLARYAKHVYVVHRRTQLSGKNQAAVDVAAHTANIEFLTPYVVKDWELDVEDQLTGATLQTNDPHKEEKILAADGAFVMIGADANTGWVKGVVDFDEDGLVRLDGGATQTSQAGIFAVGEVADNVYKQAITASAAGAQAAIDAERWLRENHGVQKHVTMPKPPQQEAPQEVKRSEKEEADDEVDIKCDLTDPQCIAEIVNSHPVVVFSKSWCPFCRKAMEALAAAGIPEPFLIDLTENSRTRDVQAALKSLTGRRTVPNVFVGGKSIGGGDETAALQSGGELTPLLLEARALAVKKDEDANNEKGEDCDLAEQSCIEAIIQKYPVVMFSLEWCPECKRTLELLDSIGAKAPHIIDLDDYKQISQDIRYHMLNISKRHSVPNLYIGGEFFGGFRQTSKMHQEGKVVAKLKEVGWPLQLEEA